MIINISHQNQKHFTSFNESWVFRSTAGRKLLRSLHQERKSEPNSNFSGGLKPLKTGYYIDSR